MVTRKKEDISDSKLTTFLILATFISLISVWVVIISLDFDLLTGQQEPQKVIIKQSPPAYGVGVIGLTILPPGSELNDTSRKEYT